MDEFAIIEKYFRPLAKGAKGALNLENDTAFYTPPKGGTLVVTTDTMIEGVHFLSNESPKTVAGRLLRMNLSDLAAAGAKPVGYLLNLSGGKVSAPWLKGFAAGLAAGQRRFGVSLFGGDTTSGAKGLCLSLSAFGTAGKTRLSRKGARAGELICVSGVIGDGLLGLRAAKRKRKTKSLKRYVLPEPRLKLGRALLGLASAAVDVSDGLLADVSNILAASRIGGTIALARVPISREGRAFARGDTRRLLSLCTGGDDYELVFTVPKARGRRLSFLAKRLRLPITVIGETAPGRGLKVVDAGGRKVAPKRKGYRHFA
jgi:thiamine-monophosphate kinase